MMKYELVDGFHDGSFIEIPDFPLPELLLMPIRDLNDTLICRVYALRPSTSVKPAVYQFERYESLDDIAA